MIFVDTGYFLALADPADEHHRRARAWNAHLTDRLVTTDYVLVETINAMSRPGYRQRAAQLAQNVIGDEGFLCIEASRDCLMAGPDLHARRPDKEWSITDCISFELMRAEGIRSALAFDHHFEQAGFEALLRWEPEGRA